MMLDRTVTQADGASISDRRKAWGNGLIRAVAIGLVFSSLFKFSQLPQPIAYLASLGYVDGTYFLIAALELAIGIVFWLPSTRPLGLLLLSSYLGGAIAAHLASGHPIVARGPVVSYMMSHPAAGIIPASLFLASAWTGVWLRYPTILSSWREHARNGGTRRARTAEAGDRFAPANRGRASRRSDSQGAVSA